MKKLFLIAAFSVIYFISFSQTNKYEYIITNWGDTIKCDIDSIGDNYIYYWEDTDVNWIKAKIMSKDVNEILTSLDSDTIYVKKEFPYKEIGNSGIYEDGSRNSLYFGVDAFTVSGSFDAFIPISRRFAYSVRVGVGFAFFLEEIVLLAENSILAGGPNHFIEGGIGYHYYTKTPEAAFITLRCGYRYQNSSGFMFRAYPAIINFLESQDEGVNSFIWFGIGIGHTF